MTEMLGRTTHALYLSARTQCEVQICYAPGHCGHLRGELCHGLAKRAARGSFLSPSAPIVDVLASSRCPEWGWLRRAPRALRSAYPPFDGRGLR
eukprot:5496462-Pyramimonas_sp.AAC.1